MASTSLTNTEADTLQADHGTDPSQETETETTSRHSRIQPTAPPLPLHQTRSQTTTMAAAQSTSPTVSDNEMLLTQAEQQLIRESNLEQEGISFLNRQLRTRTTQRRGRWSTSTTSSPLPEGPIRILLCGMGGVGKSALGNLLSQGRNFNASNSAAMETREVVSASSDYKGRRVIVYDTPGYLLRELMRGEESPTKLIKIGVNTIQEGTHVFILICNASDARQRSSEIKLIQKAKLLNQRTFRHSMLVVTHSGGHYMGKDADDFIQDVGAAEDFTTFLDNISRRVVLVELGDGEKLTRSKLESGVAYFEKEKELALEMVMEMVGKVIMGNNQSGPLYPIEQLKKDLKPCFPPRAVVYTPNGKKDMEDLALNDEVLVVNSQGQVVHEQVIMFSHANPNHRSYFCTLRTEDGKVLQLSPGHLLHVGQIGKLMPAQDVKVRDVIFSSDGDCAENLRAVRVTDISGEWLTGIYCPHTPSGSIIVDGIAASCYTNLMSPTLAHAAMFPVRMAHRLLPNGWFKWILPYNSNQGMPSLVWKLSQLI